MNIENNNKTKKIGDNKKPDSALNSPSNSRRPNRKKQRKPSNNKNQSLISKNIYSAIDLGTNNCRLLVAQQTANGFKVIDSFSRVVRLGEGLGKNDNILSMEAMDRTIEALNVCLSKIHRRGVTHMRNVATQACREAVNCDDFIERVEKEVRMKLHIIDPAEEARLAMMGCKALLEKKYSNAIIFDIGGGSTELIWVKIKQQGMPEIIDWTSIPFGVVNLSEKYGMTHAIAPHEYAHMKQTIMSAFQSFEVKNNMEELVASGNVQLLGTSGTITTLTAMDMELEVYDRTRVDGAKVASARIRELCNMLSGLNYEERLALRNIGADRADLVVAGCAILESIMDLWPIEDIRVADRGIREGMLLDMMHKFNPPPKGKGRKNTYWRKNKARKNKARTNQNKSQNNPQNNSMVGKEQND